MRTKLQLDDDVLASARVLARQRRRSVGDVIGGLALQALSKTVDGGSQNVLEQRSGLPQLPVIALPGRIELVPRRPAFSLRGFLEDENTFQREDNRFLGHPSWLWIPPV